MRRRHLRGEDLPGGPPAGEIEQHSLMACSMQGQQVDRVEVAADGSEHLEACIVAVDGVRRGRGEPLQRRARGVTGGVAGPAHRG